MTRVAGDNAVFIEVRALPSQLSPVVVTMARHGTSKGAMRAFLSREQAGRLVAALNAAIDEAT